MNTPAEPIAAMSNRELEGRIKALVDDLYRVVVAHTDSLDRVHRRETGLGGIAALLAYFFTKEMIASAGIRDPVQALGGIMDYLHIPRAPQLWEGACRRAMVKLRDEGLVDPW